jgi:hypothetical protein
VALSPGIDELRTLWASAVAEKAAATTATPHVNSIDLNQEFNRIFYSLHITDSVTVYPIRFLFTVTKVRQIVAGSGELAGNPC